LLNLVNQLLDISKIDGSKMKLELVEGDVMKYLRAVAGNFCSHAESKSIDYQMHFPPEEIKTWFDPDKLEKIAVNLLANAFKFTAEGGEISFSANYVNNQETNKTPSLELSVKDNGPGITEKYLEKIFDRFYQVEASLKKEGGGTGIGLSLARDMARLMYGDITVQSKPGVGSNFTVVLPLGLAHLKESEFIVLKEAPETLGLIPEISEEQDDIVADREGISMQNKPVILVVEDNRDIRWQLADNFVREYHIVEAIDGVAGLKKATEIIPDLVITDLMMPRMDGIELCAKLKNDERTSHIPVIMLTAKVTLEDRVTGYLTGADDYVSKPFNMAELKARVANLIEQRRKLRERFSREVTLQPGDISITPLDEKFLNRAVEIAEKHLQDEHFELSAFQQEMHMSHSTLFRKLHALTNQSPTEFIRTIRLKRAASLLSQDFGNVTQVSLEAGFNSLSYFNKSFKKLYGISPMEYAKRSRIREMG
jgi:DNA-binding response OmpR family regulator